MSEHLKRLSSELIRYANCWEDADILLKGLALRPGSKILSIGSAGDNTFSLLTTNPELIVVADLNSAQLNLMRLKMAAIAQLSQEAYLFFVGFKNASNRLETYLNLRTSLSAEARNFWDSKKQEITNGVIFCGKFEKYFSFFNKRVLPLIHQKNTVRQLFENKTEAEQIHFYNEKWNNFRWKLLFKLFFGKKVMGKYGRDPAFMKEVEVSVGEFIFKRTAQHLGSSKCQENYFLKYILLGNFNSPLPHYARKENYTLVKANLSRLLLENNYAQDAGSKYGPFDALNLSNIFEYMDAEEFKHVGEKLIHKTIPGSKIAYWNLMVNRKLNEVLPNDFELNTRKSLELEEIDKGFFYENFNIVNRT